MRAVAGTTARKSVAGKRDAGRSRRVFAIAIAAVCIASGAQAQEGMQPSRFDDGVRHWPEVRAGVVGFIASWVILTLAILGVSMRVALDAASKQEGEQHAAKMERIG